MPAIDSAQTRAVVLVVLAALAQGCGSVPDVTFRDDDAAPSATPGQTDGGEPDAPGTALLDAGTDGTANGGPPGPPAPPANTCPAAIPQGATACCSAGFACLGTCDESQCANCRCAVTELCCGETHKCAPLGSVCPGNGKGK